MFKKKADGGYTDVVKIIVALAPRERWGIYRKFSTGNIILWTTHLLQRTAIRDGQAEAARFSLDPNNPNEFEVREQ
jgi:hypothetical protein